MKYSVLIAFTVALTFVGCSDKSSLTDPAAATVSTGSADFSRMVSIGNSITSGYQSSALYEDGQQYSFPSQIAKQVKTNYVQPLISNPGIGGRIDIQSLNLATNTVTFFYNPSSGSPENPNYATPFNNLGIPGAVLYDVLHTTDFAGQGSSSRANPFFSLILRNSALGANIFQQAKKLNPTFLTLWIGNNDVLGYATSGGTAISSFSNAATPTPSSVFTNLYGELIQTIVNDTVMKKAKVAVGNIPDVQSIPFFTTVGPMVAYELQLALPAGTPLTTPVFVYQKHEGGAGVSAASVADLASGTVLLTLVASNYAPLIGTHTGKFWWDHGYNPANLGIDTTQAFGMSAKNPFPDALVLDPSEISITSAAVTSFNNTISSLVSPLPNFVLIDVNGLLKNIRANDGTGTYYNGIAFRSTFISGGLFSLDGVHPSNQGHAIIANKFIDGINAKFGASIPSINVALLPSSLHFTKSLPVSKLGLPIFPEGTFDHLLF